MSYDSFGSYLPRRTNQSPVIKRAITIPPDLIPTPVVRLEFLNHEPLSPRELGFSSDSRRIGLALHSLRLGTVGKPAGSPFTLGQMVDFRRGGNALAFEAGGWGGLEPGGTWTLGAHSILNLDLGSVPKTDVTLEVEAHAFTPPQRPEFIDSLFVNDEKVADWRLSSREALVRRQVRLPREAFSSGIVHIEFVNHDPFSPADFGLSTDQRKLGLALHYLSLRAVQ